MSDFLERMAVASRLRADRARTGGRDLVAEADAAAPPRPLLRSVEGFDLIAEAKLASPSEGRLVQDSDESERVVALASELASAGPAALSVLTEPEVFLGTLGHLDSITKSVDTPVMRKDFLVDPSQLLEARAAGASGVLLIVRILEPRLLADMVDMTLEMGMFCLVELFDETDVEPASAVFDREVLVGVNARDLKTLEVSPNRHADMARLLPPDLVTVAESGISSAIDAERVAGLGYSMALVGTSLTRAAMPGGMAAEMIASGRAVAAEVVS